jgi:hypothetical protein
MDNQCSPQNQVIILSLNINVIIIKIFFLFYFNQYPTVGSVVDNVDVIKKKFEMIFLSTQKLQEISSLDSSPILIFSQLFFKSQNVNNPQRKEVNDLLLIKWKVPSK